MAENSFGWIGSRRKKYQRQIFISATVAVQCQEGKGEIRKWRRRIIIMCVCDPLLKNRDDIGAFYLFGIDENI